MANNASPLEVLKILLKGFLGEEFFYNNINEIRRSIKDCSSFLDLGCGNNSPYLKYLHKSSHRAVAVDLYANIQSGYQKIIRSDVLDCIKCMPDKSFDVVLAFDIVEHLNEPDSWLLIREMERVAIKRVVIVTPNGFWPGMIDGPGMTHLSGITSQEFQNAGYATWGGVGSHVCALASIHL
jgi:hypothetical protein